MAGKSAYLSDGSPKYGSDWVQEAKLRYENGEAEAAQAAALIGLLRVANAMDFRESERFRVGREHRGD